MASFRHFLSLTFVAVALPATVFAQGMGMGPGAGQGMGMGMGPGAAAHADDMPMAYGQPGDAAKATRTVEVIMQDNAFSIADLTVKVGETVKFVLINKDEIEHEFVIATQAMNTVHREQMAAMGGHGQDGHGPGPGPGMAQGGRGPGNMAYLQGGQTAELVWTFTKAGALEFACNLPGHYEAGMHGPIIVKP